MTERDLSDWRGIGVGFVLILCTVGGAAMGFLAPSDWSQLEQKEIGAVILAGLYGVWALAQPSLRRATEWYVGEDQSRHEWLKNVATVLLCAVSAVACVGLFHSALRYSW
ncbi:hypothetical protein [Roseomonas sp. WA12]